MNERVIYAIALVDHLWKPFTLFLNILRASETEIKPFFIDLYSKVILKFFMMLKKIELTVKNFILKIYFLRKVYLFLKIIKKSKKRYHYGENSEDVLINSFFSKKKHGTYLDIGCYHPIRGSLTYSLYKKGWSGTNIDLSKETIDLFNNTCKKYIDEINSICSEIESELVLLGLTIDTNIDIECGTDIDSLFNSSNFVK